MVVDGGTAVVVVEEVVEDVVEVEFVTLNSLVTDRVPVVATTLALPAEAADGTEKPAEKFPLRSVVKEATLVPLNVRLPFAEAVKL